MSDIGSFNEEKGASVTLTVVINGTISIVALVLFFGCCHPALSLYSIKRKTRYLVDTIQADLNKRRNYPSNTDIPVTDAVHAASNADDTANVDVVKGDSFWARMKSYILSVLRNIWHFTLALIYPKFIKQDTLEMCQTYGRDLTTMFLYERYMIYALVICSIIGCAVLLPLHLTGRSPTPEELSGSSTDRDVVMRTHIYFSSIYMRLNDPGVLYVHLALMALFICIFMYFIVIRFMSHPIVSQLNFGSSDEKVLINEEIHQNLLVKITDTNKIRPLRNRLAMMGVYNSDQTDIESCELKHSQKALLLSPYCVSLRKLPRDMDKRTMNEIVMSAASAIPDKNLADKIAKVVLVPDLRQRIKLHNKYHSVRDELEEVKERNLFREKMGDKDSEKFTYWMRRDKITNEFHWKQTVDKEKYYTEKLNRITHDIEEWDAMYLEAYKRMGYGVVPDDFILRPSSKFQIPECSGFAYILFTTTDAARAFAKYFYRGIPLSRRQIGPDTSSTTTATKGNIFERPSDFQYHYDSEQKSWLFPTIGQKFRSKIHVRKTRHEPQDIDWMAIFEYNSLNTGTPIWRRLLMYAVITVLFVICASPLLIVSGVQSIIQLDAVAVPEEWFRRTTGTFGSFVFNYIPTFLLLIMTEILPLFVIMLALITKRSTFSTTQRKVIKRIYVFLVGSTVLLPSILLVSADGVINYYSGTNNIEMGFQKLFIISSGSFFISLLLQKALLKNSLHLFRLGSFFSYIWKMRFTQKVLLKTSWTSFLYRYLTSKEKLRIVERDSLRTEKEYAFMNWMTVITLIYSLYSPYVLLCSLMFFVYKFYADRYISTFIYGHRLSRSLKGATFGFKSDYISHHQLCVSQGALMLSNFFLFTIFYTIFFALKIPISKRFIPHTVICSVIAAASFCSIFIFRWVMSRVRIANIRKNNRCSSSEDTSQISVEKEEGIEVEREVFRHAYEPYGCYHIPSLYISSHNE